MDFNKLLSCGKTQLFDINGLQIFDFRFIPVSLIGLMW